ncbi:fimbria/pilus outer membrane usher protein [Citrobacter amalonaticus]|uniref:fimbria/pilus outer membrane usher protein n=1 Tax=Citrobacter amalonaticus TaxID=35703 RepID=UPI001A278594|nr:fimbrial biogenesis outer membrane usher protein [Citrobacter amalonaticus]HDQ2810007.1 fimbrial biogenesis outer membrane usher protein [Citrobacter amalonaticus]
MVSQIKSKRIKHSSLTGLLILAGIAPAWGRDYFDAALLRLDGSQTTTADLSMFETAGTIPPGNYLVEVYVNDVEKGLHNINFISSPETGVQPELSPTLLYELGVKTDTLPAFSGLEENSPILNLSSVIEDASAKFDFQEQRLNLSIPQVAMKTNIQGATDPRQWDDGIPALMMNYSLSGGRSWQQGSQGMSGSQNSNLFANLRGGVNWQAWRLRSDYTFTHNENEINNGKRQQNQTTRFSDTYLSRDIRAWRSEILIGENSTANDVFDSIPFKGVKLNSNEEMLPTSQRGFAPVLTGVAQSNARVTVSQNGRVIYETYVAPGAFRIEDLYQSGQSGDLTLTINESDGTVRTQTQAYSTLPVMQRPGKIKYEITGGRFNGGTTKGSREEDFVLGTLIYGLPWDVTLYGGGLLAEDYYSLAAGAGLSLGVMGALSADITTSSAQLPDEEKRRKGTSLRLRYAKSLLSTGTSVDLAAYRYSTRDYYNFSDFNSFGYQLKDDQVPWAMARQRSSFQLRLRQQLGAFGSLYLSAARNDYWNSNRVNNTVSAGYNGSLYGVSYGLIYTIDRIKSDGNWPENRQLSLNLNIPFSLFNKNSGLSTGYANWQMTHNNAGQVQQQLGLSGTALDNRLSWNATQSLSNNQNSDDATSLNVGYQGSKGAANLGYSYSNSYRSVNMNANGGLVVHSAGLTLSQTLGDSMAVVSARRSAGASVMGNLQTDSRGFAVIPHLANYQSNDINLDPSTLPDDVDIVNASQRVTPTKGAVVLARFETRVGLQVLITLTNKGVLLPFGAMVTVHDSENGTLTGIVGEKGQVYMNGMPESGRLQARWGSEPHQQCSADFELNDSQQISKNNPVRMLTLHCEGQEQS